MHFHRLFLPHDEQYSIWGETLQASVCFKAAEWKGCPYKTERDAETEKRCMSTIAKNYLNYARQTNVLSVKPSFNGKRMADLRKGLMVH